jgi:tetratricopeptide (TPR) repeat protein
MRQRRAAGLPQSHAVAGLLRRRGGLRQVLATLVVALVGAAALLTQPSLAASADAAAALPAPPGAAAAQIWTGSLLVLAQVGTGCDARQTLPLRLPVAWALPAEAGDAVVWGDGMETLRVPIPLARGAVTASPDAAGPAQAEPAAAGLPGVAAPLMPLSGLGEPVGLLSPVAAPAGSDPQAPQQSADRPVEQVFAWAERLPPGADASPAGCAYTRAELRLQPVEQPDQARALRADADQHLQLAALEQRLFTARTRAEVSAVAQDLAALLESPRFGASPLGPSAALADRLSHLSQLAAGRRQPVLALRLAEHSSALYRQRQARSPEPAAQALLHEARLRHRSGQRAAATALVAEALQLLTRHGHAASLAAADAQALIGAWRMRDGDYAAARQAFELQVQTLLASQSPRADLAAARHNLAHVQHALGHRRQAIALWQVALADAQADPLLGEPIAALIRQSLAALNSPTRTRTVTTGRAVLPAHRSPLAARFVRGTLLFGREET